MIEYKEVGNTKIQHSDVDLIAAKIDEGKNSECISRSFIEIPDGEAWEINLVTDDGTTTLASGVAKEDTGKCVLMCKVRVRSDASGVVEPPKEEEEEIIE